MSKNFLERLKNDAIVYYVPMQTLLVDWGKDMESHLSEWILANPEKYQDALRQSYGAGCDVGFTATQASSVFRAKPFGLQDRVYELNYKSAKLAKEVTPPDHYVAGLVSTTSPDFMEPLGNMTYNEVYEGYKIQILALAEGGVDLFNIGGNHIDEAIVAIKVAKDHTDLPVVGQNIFYRRKKGGFRTMMGVDPIAGSAKLEEAGADVVGFNCGLVDYKETSELIRQMKQGTSKYLVAQPDAGLPGLVDGVTVHPLSPEEMGKEVPNWIKAGARIVGGCCGTSLRHYQMVSAAVRELRAKGI